MHPFEMPSSRTTSSTEDHTSTESTHREPKKVNELLETAKFEIGEAREENKRLKRKLAQMEKDYRSMQVQFFDILRQEASSRRSPDDGSCSLEDTKEESGLVSLRLGMNPVAESRDKEEKQTKEHSPKVVDAEDEGLDTKLQLSAEVKASSTSPRLEEKKDEEETWPPNKVQKTSSGEHDDDASPQTQPKRTRVSVRARCDSPTMNDGCQWRKYGQKISKGNPCPRAYYRCTVSPGCPVRKQVQRCVDDMSILTTTYEGTHNHPLPVSATAMASTTSAAATMLLSGSSTSTRPPATISGYNGLNFSIYDNNSGNRFYMPNTPLPSLHPTITLDLTTPPMAPQNRFNYSMPPPGFPPLNTFNFSASGQAAGMVPPPWSSYTSRPNPNFQSYMAPNYTSSSSSSSSQQQQSLTETLTKALTTDPSFQSVIAAALSSMVAPNINRSGR